MSVVCYQVHSHHAPAQVERLVRHLVRASTGAVVLVSHDVRGEPLDARALERIGDVHVLHARGGYGDFSHVDRWVDASRWLDTHGVDYDWMVTVSGQDYPVRPLAQVECELRASAVDGYVEHFPVFGRSSRWPRRRGRIRYLYRHHRLPGMPGGARAVLRLASAVSLVQPLLALNAAYGTIGVRAPTPLGPDFPLFGGSFFTTLRRECVEYVRAFYEQRPAVVRYFRGTLAPEEVYFQTVLLASGRFTLSGDCKRFFDFASGDGARPRLLDMVDLPALLSSGAHFARKFDVGYDTGILDALDDALAPLGRPSAQ